MSRFKLHLPTPASSIVLALMVLAGGAVLPGCGQLISELSSDQMAVGVLLQSPSVQDPSTGHLIQGPAVFTLAFANVNKSALNMGGTTQAATPSDGATVQLQYHDAAANKDVSIPVPGVGNGSGTYTVSSLESQLTYQENQPYTVVISYSGKTYKMNVTAPPPIGIKEFEPPNSQAQTNYQPGTAFTMTRDPMTDNRVAFYDLASISNGSVMQVKTNAPQTVTNFLTFILNDSPFRQPTFTIDGSYFQAHTPYLISLTSMTEGSQVDMSQDPSVSALFTGSTFLAGAATGGTVVTK